MRKTKMIMGAVGATAFSMLSVLPAFAQEAAEAAAPIVDKGDTAWMMTATVLVMAMIVPGLALFYGGLVRTKNMLSVLTQIIAVASLAMVVWVLYGYSMAFGGGDLIPGIVGNFDKIFLNGVTVDSVADTFSDGFKIPEYVFIAFQMTFAAITVALVVGGLVERLKFSALMLFALIWLTIVYFPIAHMVWGVGGIILDMGAYDFAGGTVVHINAGVSALVGAIILGKRIGYQKEIMAPHSLTMTLIGTGLLWVGWFGFNAGSALEANGSAALAMINTFAATAGGVLFWMLTEKALGHKGSMLGACSGAIAGLVAITPAAGNAGPAGAILLGGLSSVICCYFVMKLKAKFGFDDSLDAFGIHGLGGIVGSIGVAIVNLPGLGGQAGDDYDLMGQLGIQIAAVGIAVAWATIGSAIAFYIVKAVIGLRVSEEVEREGLDLGEHGERAYNY
ncbi:ammonia channel protein [Sphingorhabdus lutea]|uniref:Ammonium transporter n=1 Tax=Sphingorhabdus lutea TaxID=1913578 RepID=A0A1L3JEB6_9SPHN|nr:ammonium transporter [Sphingorhabdus lutea]APG63470.1 ammonia channel protein [Sphingorhabdus lutea]